MSGGGLMTSRIAHTFGPKFKAYIIHSAGNIETMRFNLFELPKLNFKSSNIIYSNHSPTLIVHGARDKIVPMKCGITYYEGTAIWTKNSKGVNNEEAMNTIFPHCKPIRKHIVFEKRIK